MSAAILSHSNRTAGAARPVADVRSVCGNDLAATGTPGHVTDTRCVSAAFDKGLAGMERQDDAAISHALPSMASGSPIRAVFTVEGELTRLAVALAFFRSRSLPNGTAVQIGRLRV